MELVIHQDQEKTHNDELAKVEFTIRCTIASEDDIMCLLGSTPSLGQWKHNHAEAMTCTERKDDESIWTIVLELPCQQVLEYKYVLRRSGEVTRWETITGNRTITPGVVNFAIGKPVEQKSTHYASSKPVPGKRAAEIANNGNTNGYHEWLCCHTNEDTEPWWQLDLTMKIPISSINLWNRQDRCIERLFPVWILISETPFHSDSLETSIAHSLASKRFEDVKRTTEWHFDAGAECVGRYVRVQLEGQQNFLHFAELEVLHRVNYDFLNTTKLYELTTSSDSKSRERVMLVSSPIHDQAHTSLTHTIDDGFFGLDVRDVDKNASRDSHKLQIDEGWLSPESGSELRLTLGTFAGNAAIHLLRPRPVKVEMRVVKDTCVHWPFMNGSSQVIVASTVSANPIASEGEDTFRPHGDAQKTERYAPISDREKMSETTSPRVRAGSLDLADDTQPLSETVSHKNVLTLSCLRNILALKTLSDRSLAQLAKKMIKTTFEINQTIIRVGDIRSSLYVIESGHVVIVLANAIVGERTLRTLGPGAHFGAMALLSEGHRTATVKVSPTSVEPVVCYQLDRKDFIQVLGTLDHHRLIEKHLKMTELTPISSQLGHLEVSGTAGQVASSDAIQMFKIRMDPMDPFTSRFMLDVYVNRHSCDNNSSADPSNELSAAEGGADLIGTAYILPSQMHRTNGCLTAPVISMSAMQLGQSPIVGQLLVRYLWINPLVHHANNLSTVWRNHWKKKPTLDVGHRGLGRSYHQVDNARPAFIRENSLVSFMVAGQLGADFIEFDVQLTKDRVPVVYHDFFVEVGLEDSSEDSHGEHYKIGIHNLTIRHLDRCKIKPVQKRSFQFQRLVKKHWKKLVKSSSQRFEESARDTEQQGPSKDRSVINSYLSHLLDVFPRLRHVLECVPQKVGLNIEIKYPMTKNRQLRDLPSFELNSYVDSILKTVFDHAGTRRIIFSCFDPDVCIILRAKQARYPIFFLTSGKLTDTETADARCLSVEAALLFAKMERLQGIVSNSAPLLANTDLIHKIKNAGIILFTWGNLNSIHSNVKIQKMHGVDAVICDNVGDLTKLDGKILNNGMNP